MLNSQSQVQEAFDLARAWLEQQEPLVAYPLGAAALLTVASLGSGLLRLDFLTLLRARILLRLLAGVALGFLVMVVAELLGPLPLDQLLLFEGAARIPLYVVALAYGPTAGLAAGALFSAATASGAYPGVNEALFAFELMVVGWLAIYPSPRISRWAGPLNAAFGFALASFTARLVLHGLAVTSGDGAITRGAAAVFQFGLQLSPELPGLTVAWLLLYFVKPAWYERFMPFSPIAPTAKSVGATTTTATAAPAVHGAQSGWESVPAELARPRRRQREALLPLPKLTREDPNA